MKWAVELLWDGIRIVLLALAFGAVILAVQAAIEFSFDWSNWQ